VKTTDKHNNVVEALMLYLRLGLKVEYIDKDLPDNTTWWRSEWFYITD
jgi:hypothetical protein